MSGASGLDGERFDEAVVREPRGLAARLQSLVDAVRRILTRQEQRLDALEAKLKENGVI
jgi:hypothetical protein